MEPILANTVALTDTRSASHTATRWRLEGDNVCSLSVDALWVAGGLGETFGGISAWLGRS